MDAKNVRILTFVNNVQDVKIVIIAYIVIIHITATIVLNVIFANPAKIVKDVINVNKVIIVYVAMKALNVTTVHNVIYAYIVINAHF